MAVQRLQQASGSAVVMRHLYAHRLVAFLLGGVYLVAVMVDMDSNILCQSISSGAQAVVTEVGSVWVAARPALACVALEVV